jgi:hypothetical protein
VESGAWVEMAAAGRYAKEFKMADTGALAPTVTG